MHMALCYFGGIKKVLYCSREKPKTFGKYNHQKYEVILVPRATGLDLKIKAAAISRLN